MLWLCSTYRCACTVAHQRITRFLCSSGSGQGRTHVPHGYTAHVCDCVVCVLHGRRRQAEQWESELEHVNLELQDLQATSAEVAALEEQYWWACWRTLCMHCIMGS